MTAYFDSGTGRTAWLVPTPLAASAWGWSQMRGSAVTGALARVAESSPDFSAEMHPARTTFELFRPVQMAPCRTTVTTNRRGRRLRLLDSELVQDGDVVARARVLLLARSAEPVSGIVWHPLHTPNLPPTPARTTSAERRLYFSDDTGWTSDPESQQNSARKQTWHLPLDVVAGENVTSYQRLASVADVANLVTNWGDAGIEFINADVTLSLARISFGDAVGLSAHSRVEADGIAVGSALVFDRMGPLGTASVTSLVNTRRTVNLSPASRRRANDANR